MKAIFSLLLLFTVSSGSFCQTSTPTPAAMWHFEGDRYDVESHSDWVYSVIPTEKNQYIGCGYSGINGFGFVPVIFKLDNFGRLLWSKIVQNVSGVGLTSTGNKVGLLNQVIKTPDGYVAAGYLARDTTPGPTEVLIVEFDEDGNYLNSGNMLYSFGTDTVSCRSQSIVMAPDDASYYISGMDGDAKGFVAQIDYSSKAVINKYANGGVGAGRNMFTKVVVRSTTSSYEVIACGQMSMKDDLTVVSGKNADGTTVNLRKNEKDIWVVSLTPALSSTENFSVTYNKSDFGAITYNDFGPATARTINNSGTSPLNAGNASPVMRQHLNSSVNNDERGDDVIISADGKIVITGLVNIINIWGYGDGNGEQIFQNSSGIYDGNRPFNYKYYADADGYLVKLEPSDGSIIWDRNVAHYSSEEFYMKVIQQSCGDFIIAGSSADYNLNIDEYDAQLIGWEDHATNPSYTHKWKRYMHPNEVDNMCVFSIAETNDGGFVIGGDNDAGWSGAAPEYDNFAVTKFGAPGLKGETQNYDLYMGTYVVGADVSNTWPSTGTNAVPNGAKIAGKIVVPNGETLTISNMNITFAPSEHIYDYWSYGSPTTSNGIHCGIIVEPGGELIIEESTLEGFTICGDQRFMWDGIVILGNPEEEQDGSNQGVITITESEIKDARIGISIVEAKRSYVHTQNSQIVDNVRSDCWNSSYNATYSLGGGILDMSNTLVENCRFGVRTHSYPGIPNNPCTIYGSHFVTTAPMADMYFYTDGNGRRLPHSTFVTAVEIDGIDIKATTFEGDDSFDEDIRGYGIASHEAGMNIVEYCNLYNGNGDCISGSAPNVFKNLRFGIHASYSPMHASLPLNISYNLFQNNSNSVTVVTSLNGLKLHKNSFEIGDINSGISQMGANIVGSHGYDISDNNFYAAGPDDALGYIGLNVKNAHSENNLIYGNRFERLALSAISLQDNGTIGKGLEWKCNDFHGPEILTADILRLSTDNSTNPPTVVGGTMNSQQGYCAGSPLDNDWFTAPAGNRFFNSCSIFDNNHLYADADAEATFVVDYYYNQSATAFDPGVCVNTIAYDLFNCNTGAGEEEIQLSCPRDYEIVEGLMKISSIQSELGQSAVVDAEYVQALERAKYLIVSNVARRYGHEKKYDSAAHMLAENGRYNDAIPFYIQAKMFTEARSAWELMPKSTPRELQFAILTDSAINLAARGASWRDMNNGGKANLLQMSYINDNTGYMAMAAAVMAGLRDFADPRPVKPEISSRTHSTGTEPGGDNRETLVQQSTPHQLLIYPNPTKGDVNVHTHESGQLEIFDLQGRKLMKRTINNGNSKLDIREIGISGLYIVKFISDSGVTTAITFAYQP